MTLNQATVLLATVEEGFDCIEMACYLHGKPRPYMFSFFARIRFPYA